MSPKGSEAVIRAGREAAGPTAPKGQGGLE